MAQHSTAQHTEHEQVVSENDHITHSVHGMQHRKPQHRIAQSQRFDSKLSTILDRYGLIGCDCGRQNGQGTAQHTSQIRWEEYRSTALHAAKRTTAWRVTSLSRPTAGTHENPMQRFGPSDAATDSSMQIDSRGVRGGVPVGKEGGRGGGRGRGVNGVERTVGGGYLMQLPPEVHV